MNEHHHNHDYNHYHSVNEDNKRILLLSFGITFAFMLIEVMVGWWSNSLALLSDAGHMLSDAASLAMSLWAFKWAEKSANAQKSFGYHRAEILAAAINGLALVLICVWIVLEAIIRSFEPVAIASTPMLVVATLGLVVNMLVVWLMMRGEHDNLNMHSAFLHVLGDLLGSVAAIIAAILMKWFGWQWADLVASVLVALLVGKSGWRVLHRSVHILMESTPEGVNLLQLTQQIRAIDGVLAVHDVHAWTIKSQKHALSCHIVVADDCLLVQAQDLMGKVQRVVQAQGIEHVTVQVETAQMGGHHVCNHF